MGTEHPVCSRVGNQLDEAPPGVLLAVSARGTWSSDSTRSHVVPGLSCTGLRETEDCDLWIAESDRRLTLLS